MQGTYRVVCANDPVNFVDPLGLARKQPFELHHIFPREIFGSGSKYLSERGFRLSKGLDIDNHGFLLFSGDHTGAKGLHPNGYNQYWKDWLDRLADDDNFDGTITRKMLNQEFNSSRFRKTFSGTLKKGFRARISFSDWGKGNGYDREKYLLNHIDELAETAKKRGNKKLLAKLQFIENRWMNWQDAAGLASRGGKRIFGKKAAQFIPLLGIAFTINAVTADYSRGGVHMVLKNSIIPAQDIEDFVSPYIHSYQNDYSNWIDQKGANLRINRGLGAGLTPAQTRELLGL